ncbi:MAG TPA: acyl carrier protein [Solirubrobacterales bacterium]|nr:acyl carrier protein [Solirubrobacterales bacterium]
MSDNAKTIEEFIVNEITGDLEAGSLRHDEDLLAADLIDSLGITELVSFLEAKFGLKVDDEDLTPDNFRSVDSIVAFVARKGG